MAVPFLLGPGEQVLKESFTDFKMEEGRDMEAGLLFLTNERVVVVRSKLFKKEIAAVVPLGSLVAVELEARLQMLMKSWGFKIQFRDAQGALSDIRFIKERSLRSGAKTEWAQEWVDDIRKVIEARQRAETESASVPQHSTAPSSSLDELEKLAALRDKGIVTAEEFETKKKQLLGL